MKIYMQDGLPIVSMDLSYKGYTMYIVNILLDTGCSIRILMLMKLRKLNLLSIVKMAVQEECIELLEKASFVFEQTVIDLEIDNYLMNSFRLQ